MPAIPKQSETQAKRILALEADLGRARKTIRHLEATIRERDRRIGRLESEIIERDANLDRMAAILNDRIPPTAPTEIPAGLGKSLSVSRHDKPPAAVIEFHDRFGTDIFIVAGKDALKLADAIMGQPWQPLRAKKEKAEEEHVLDAPFPEEADVDAATDEE